MKTLRVLQFICPVGFYGAERWILALANNLDSNLVSCDLAVTRESDRQNLEIVDHYPRAAGETFQLPMRGRFDWRVVAGLCELIKRRDIDVIHTHGYKSDLLGLVAARKAGIKCISTPHGFGDKIGLKMKLFVKLGCFSFRFFDKVVPLSEKLYDDVVKMGVPAGRLLYIRNGVDLSEVDAVARAETRSDEKPEGGHIGFVGQMIPRKGIGDLLRIFDRLWSTDKSLQLSLLGDGESREQLQAFARTLPSAANINFLGFRADRLEMMQHFDLFAMTSSKEGIPRCLMEAVAMQIPVAAYDIPGIDQLVEHEKTALLAQPGDMDTLAEYWRKLLYDRPYARALAASGREFVQRKFSAARMAREYSDLFYQLCDRRIVPIEEV